MVQALATDRLNSLENEVAHLHTLLADRLREGNSAPQAPLTAISSDPNVPNPAQPQPEPENNTREEILDLFDLEESIAAYRQMSTQNFPFVTLSGECSATSLARYRPLLSLAIGVATAWKDYSLQSRIRRSFLQQLSIRYFFKHERSLDLIQALLVYTSW